MCWLFLKVFEKLHWRCQSWVLGTVSWYRNGFCQFLDFYVLYMFWHTCFMFSQLIFLCLWWCLDVMFGCNVLFARVQLFFFKALSFVINSTCCLRLQMRYACFGEMSFVFCIWILFLKFFIYICVGCLIFFPQHFDIW